VSLTTSLLVLALVTGAARPESARKPVAELEQLELISGERLAGRTTALKLGKLSFESGGKNRHTAISAVVRLVRARGVATTRKTDGVVLLSGDVVEGDALQLLKGRLKLDSARFGKLDIPAKDVRALFFGQNIGEVRGKLPSGTDAEVVMLTGSRTPAEIRWLDSVKIGLASPLGALDVKKADVAWVFGKQVKPQAAIKGSLRVVLTTGEVLTGRKLELVGGRLKMLWAGHRVKVSWALVKRIESAGGAMVYLGELKPSGRKSEAAVGPVRMPRVNRCANGDPLRLDGKARELGIGMRARSELSYKLDGKWKRFRALIGLDTVAARASRGAIFVVRVDGKKVFEKKVAPGQKSVEIDVVLKGARTLQLVLEAGDGFEIGDYGNWVDARLLR
jgi:NPCBM/NEW2 domain